MPGSFTIIPTIALSAGWGDGDVGMRFLSDVDVDVIDDHALDFYFVARGIASLHSYRISTPDRTESLESSKGYIDQSMLAPTESRTILPYWRMWATWKRADNTTANVLMA